MYVCTVVRTVLYNMKADTMLDFKFQALAPPVWVCTDGMYVHAVFFECKQEKKCEAMHRNK